MMDRGLMGGMTAAWGVWAFLVILTLLAILVVAVLASVWLVRKLREGEHAPVAHPALGRSGAAPLATTRP